MGGCCPFRRERPYFPMEFHRPFRAHRPLSEKTACHGHIPHPPVDDEAVWSDEVGDNGIVVPGVEGDFPLPPSSATARATSSVRYRSNGATFTATTFGIRTNRRQKSLERILPPTAG